MRPVWIAIAAALVACGVATEPSAEQCEARVAAAEARAEGAEATASALLARVTELEDALDRVTAAPAARKLRLLGFGARTAEPAVRADSAEEQDAASEQINMALDDEDGDAEHAAAPKADESDEPDADEANDATDSAPHSKHGGFHSSDHTDLYTARRDRDRQWEQAKRTSGGGAGVARSGAGASSGAGGGSGSGSSAPRQRRTAKGQKGEPGRWLRRVGADEGYIFVSERASCQVTEDGLACHTPAADLKLRTVLDLEPDTDDAELLNAAKEPYRWLPLSDATFRDRLCRGAKHDMPRWCKQSAGPGGKDARALDLAEQTWKDATVKRQQLKQALLAEQKECMWKAACSVDPEAAGREKKLIKELREADEEEAEAWEKLVDTRKLVEKYRTLSKDQLSELQREEHERQRYEREHERAAKIAAEKEKEQAVEKAKRRAIEAQRQLEKALRGSGQAGGAADAGQ